MGTMVSISLADFDELRDARGKQAKEIADLKKQLTEAKLGDPGSQTRVASELARTSLEIVRFAIANLSPEFAQKWPHEALVKVADFLDKMPDKTHDDGDFVIVMRHFAKECERFDKSRSLASLRRLEKEAEERKLKDLANRVGAMETEASTQPEIEIE